MINKNNKTFNKEKLMFYILMFFYIFILFKLILFKDIPLRSLTKIFSSGFEGFRGLNVMPFASIIDMFTDPSVGIIKFIINIMANVLIFVPLGILLKIKNENFSLLKIVMLTSIFSLSLEMTQYFLKIGISDIDDIILNSLGGLLGAVLINIIGKRRVGISPNILLVGMMIFLSIALYMYNQGVFF